MGKSPAEHYAELAAYEASEAAMLQVAQAQVAAGTHTWGGQPPLAPAPINVIDLKPPPYMPQPVPFTPEPYYIEQVSEGAEDQSLATVERQSDTRMFTVPAARLEGLGEGDRVDYIDPEWLTPVGGWNTYPSKGTQTMGGGAPIWQQPQPDYLQTARQMPGQETGGYSDEIYASIDAALMGGGGGSPMATTYPAGSTVEETSNIAPLAIAGAAALVVPLVGRVISLGIIRQIIARFGPVAVKLAIGTLAFNEVMDLIGLGAPDGSMFQFGKKKKKRRRYSIGANPRVRTLAKVSGHCKRLLKRHEKVIREFLPKPRRTYGQLPSSLLSAAEKKLLK